MRHRPSTALVIQAAVLVAVMLPWASAAQSPSFTFGPANYFPPATGSAGSTSTKHHTRCDKALPIRRAGDSLVTR